MTYRAWQLTEPLRKEAERLEEVRWIVATVVEAQGEPQEVRTGLEAPLAAWLEGRFPKRVVADPRLVGQVWLGYEP